MSELPYAASIDYMVGRNTEFFKNLHKKLFEDFKRQWLAALPLCPKREYPKIEGNMKKIISNVNQEAWHEWAHLVAG